MRIPKALQKVHLTLSRKKGRKKNRVHPDSVLWWASVNQREPFIGAAKVINLARKQGRKNIEVIWHADNSMEVIFDYEAA